MADYFFWDIENVSFHNLETVMKHVNDSKYETFCYVIYAKIKESRKDVLEANGWNLIEASEISKNSADKKIHELINNLIVDNKTNINKIFIITEDKGFKKISKKIIQLGIELEIICNTKNPQWVREINQKRNHDMEGNTRSNIKKGMKVSIVLKKDQATGKLTQGIVKDLLTKAASHPHGIKVRLESGLIGRVKEILD